MSKAVKPAHRGRSISHAEFTRMWCDPSVRARDIAEYLGVTVQAVHHRAMARNLQPRPGGGGMNRKVEPTLFREMWMANVSATDIAIYFGLSHPNAVSKRAREWGFPKRKCTRWNMVPMMAFMLAKSARAEQAAFIAADMADKCRNNRIVGADRARAAA